MQCTRSTRFPRCQTVSVCSLIFSISGFNLSLSNARGRKGAVAIYSISQARLRHLQRSVPDDGTHTLDRFASSTVCIQRNPSRWNLIMQPFRAVHNLVPSLRVTNPVGEEPNKSRKVGKELHMKKKKKTVKKQARRSEARPEEYPLLRDPQAAAGQNHLQELSRFGQGDPAVF